MYSGPWLEKDNFAFIDWPKDYVPDSIRDLAFNISEKINYNPIAIAGSSLGGMVALELADILQVEKVILLGSATSNEEINPLLKALGPLSDITPMRFCQFLAGKTPALLSQMYSEQNPQFIRSMIQSVLYWSYSGKAKIYRIHGKKDHVIKAKEADLWLDAGHLIAMTHSKDCVHFIESKKTLN